MASALELQFAPAIVLMRAHKWKHDFETQLVPYDLDIQRIHDEVVINGPTHFLGVGDSNLIETAHVHSHALFKEFDELTRQHALDYLEPTRVKLDQVRRLRDLAQTFTETQLTIIAFMNRRITDILRTSGLVFHGIHRMINAIGDNHLSSTEGYSGSLENLITRLRKVTNQMDFFNAVVGDPCRHDRCHELKIEVEAFIDMKPHMDRVFVRLERFATDDATRQARETARRQFDARYNLELLLNYKNLRATIDESAARRDVGAPTVENTFAGLGVPRAIVTELWHEIGHFLGKPLTPSQSHYLLNADELNQVWKKLLQLNMSTDVSKPHVFLTMAEKASDPPVALVMLLLLFALEKHIRKDHHLLPVVEQVLTQFVRNWHLRLVRAENGHVFKIELESHNQSNRTTSHDKCLQDQWYYRFKPSKTDPEMGPRHIGRHLALFLLVAALYKQLDFLSAMRDFLQAHPCEHAVVLATFRQYHLFDLCNSLYVRPV